MVTTLIANAARLANSPEAPKCRGWDPERCEAPKVGIDYCDGFRLFVEYADAMEYGAGLGGTFTLGFDRVVQRWAVTPLGDGTYGS